jgi:hypothetical protein
MLIFIKMHEVHKIMLIGRFLRDFIKFEPKELKVGKMCRI